MRRIGRRSIWGGHRAKGKPLLRSAPNFCSCLIYLLLSLLDFRGDKFAIPVVVVAGENIPDLVLGGRSRLVWVLYLTSLPTPYTGVEYIAHYVLRSGHLLCRGSA